jgi:hypothetical protein
MTDVPAHDELAERLMRAFEANDTDAIAACFEPDGVLGQNANPAAPITEALPALATLHERIGWHKYVNVRRATFSDGFVEEHDVETVLPDGSSLSIPAVCVVARVGPNGLVAEFREYSDMSNR